LRRVAGFHLAKSSCRQSASGPAGFRGAIKSCYGFWFFLPKQKEHYLGDIKAPFYRNLELCITPSSVSLEVNALSVAYSE
jgi:hypothetical protein